MDNSGSGVVQVFVGEWSIEYEALSIKATKQTSSAEIVECIIERLGLSSASNGYELAEVVGNSVGQECKERRLGPTECPVALMLLWPKNDAQQEYYRSARRYGAMMARFIVRSHRFDVLASRDDLNLIQLSDFIYGRSSQITCGPTVGFPWIRNF